MTKNILLCALIIGAFTLFGKSLKAQFGGIDTSDIKAPVVVELFTSQSCSSCPPADKNLAALSKNPNVIALGFHVTYWNHLHWKDTLSQKFSTDRQRSYSSYNRKNRVYTPQMVVNGQDEFVGNNARKIKIALDKAKPIRPITLSKQGSKLKVSIPEFPRHTSKPTHFWLFGVKDTHTQDIPSGENRGRTVSYHNAVLNQKSITRSGQVRSFEIENPNWSGIDKLILIAQDGKYGAITAAGIVD